MFAPVRAEDFEFEFDQMAISPGFFSKPERYDGMKPTLPHLLFERAYFLEGLVGRWRYKAKDRLRQHDANISLVSDCALKKIQINKIMAASSSK